MVLRLLPFYAAFWRDKSYLPSVCSTVSFSLFGSLQKKNGTSSVKAEWDVLTPIANVCLNSQIWVLMFSATLSCGVQRKSVTVFTEPAMCSIL